MVKPVALKSSARARVTVRARWNDGRRLIVGGRRNRMRVVVSSGVEAIGKRVARLYARLLALHIQVHAALRVTLRTPREAVGMTLLIVNRELLLRCHASFERKSEGYQKEPAPHSSAPSLRLSVRLCPQRILHVAGGFAIVAVANCTACADLIASTNFRLGWRKGSIRVRDRRSPACHRKNSSALADN
jgi:hypothetical protein